MRVLLFSFLTPLFFINPCQAEKFSLDTSHTTISFTAPHLVVSKVKGRFEKFDGHFNFDEKNMKLEDINVNIKTDSISTNEKDRDKHLRSPDFFDVAKYPDMTFKSTKVEYQNNKPTKVHGDLTIHGISKPVVLEVTYGGAINDLMGNRVVAFEASSKVNRKDFGLKWNKTLDLGGVVVGDEIKIQIEGEAKVASLPEATKK